MQSKSSRGDQIDRIISTGNSKNAIYDVIVWVGNGESESVSPKARNKINRSLASRLTTGSARSLLPAKRRGKRSSTAIEDKLAGRLARANSVRHPIAKYKKAASKLLQPIKDLSSIQKSLQRMSVKKTKDIPYKWTSKSLRVSIKKDELFDLKNKKGIRGFFLNRRLSVPFNPTAKKNSLSSVKNDRDNASTWGIERIGALAAWGAFDARGARVKVGVLDTGVDASHPDLLGKVKNWCEFDANGDSTNRLPFDSGSHGTHVCGTIAGGNASGKWIGVAPDVDLAVGKVLGRHGGNDWQILSGIEWAIDVAKVDVLNLSLGGAIVDGIVPDSYTEAFLLALESGIPVVTAIGNDGQNITSSPGNCVYSFGVGATDFRERSAGFSGGASVVLSKSKFFSKKQLPLLYSKPDVSSPGVDVWSSIPNGKYALNSGTSMASPHVAGALALLLSSTSIGSEVPAEERAMVLQNLLTGAVEDLGEAGQDHRFGHGRIDILRAISIARDLGY